MQIIPMSLDLRRIEYFVAVAEELHFSRAAARLGMAQPPLSQQIQKLETELGARLFDRSRRAVTLTDAGRALLPEARRLIAMSHSVAGIPRAVEDGTAGRLRIGLTGSTGFRIVPILLRHYRAEFPDVDLQLFELPTADQLERIVDGTLDLGLVREPILRDDLTSASVWTEPLIAALPADHRLAETDPIDPKSLEREGFVMFPRQRGPGLHELVVGMCHDAGFAPRIVQEAVQMQTIIGLVAAGFGIAVVPASVQDFRLRGVVYRPIREPVPRSTIAIVSNPQLTSAVRDRFLDLALKHTSGEPVAVR